MRLSSVVFQTRQLSELRKFYEDVLGLQLATYSNEDGNLQPECSEIGVGYQMSNGVITFESHTAHCNLGMVIINVDRVQDYSNRLEQSGVDFTKVGDRLLLVRDPEGRRIVLEAAS